MCGSHGWDPHGMGSSAPPQCGFSFCKSETNTVSRWLLDGVLRQRNGREGVGVEWRDLGGVCVEILF